MSREDKTTLIISIAALVISAINIGVTAHTMYLAHLAGRP